MKSATVLALLFAVSGFAQQTAPPPLVEKVDVTLVNVDVSVLDPKGNPVTDLKKEDFEVREDGVVREITNFSLARREVAPSKGEPQAELITDPEQRRSAVVLIDMRALGEKPNRVRAVDALEKTLGSYRADSNWSIVILRDGARSMQTLLPMTTDRESIRWAFDKVRAGEFTVGKALATGVPKGSAFRGSGTAGPDATAADTMAGLDAAQQIVSNAQFAGCVIQVARGAAWLPGKKIILIVSANVPGYMSVGMASPETAKEQSQLHEAMVQEANAADASIFVIDPLGVNAPLNMEGGPAAYAEASRGSAFNDSRRNTAAAEWLAAKTGGMYMPSNDMGQSLDKLQKATATYYELAYHTAQADDKYHQIAVALKKPGRYTVTYRQGYLRLSKEAGFARALLSPLGIASQHPTLPLQLTVGKPEQSGNEGFAVSFRAEMPVRLLQSVPGNEGRVARAHVYVSIFDRNGQPVQLAQFIETMTGVKEADDRSLVVTRAIRLPKGTWKVFITFRDEVNDNVGIASKEINL